jgi:hypothetical protein
MVGAPAPEFLRPGEALIPAIARAGTDTRDDFLSWIEESRRDGGDRELTASPCARGAARGWR